MIKKNNFKLFALFTLLLLLSFSCKKSTSDTPVASPNTPPPIINPSATPIVLPNVYTGYNLIWNDEFNSASIDTSKWNFEIGTGVNGDFGTGQLDRATASTKNANIENGATGSGGGSMAITTQKEYYIDRNYTSARLNSKGKGSWGPGSRIEARIWAKDVLYKGQGFAFWMMPAEFPANQTYIMWPQGGEIDIMEYIGSVPFANLGSVHYAWSWQNNQFQSWNHGHKGGYYSYSDGQVPVTNPGWGGYPAKASDPAAGSGGFHLYRLDWFADRMEFSIDENVYHIHYFNDGAAFNDAPDGKDAEGVQVISGKRVYKSEYTSKHFPEWSPFEHKFFIMLTAGVGGNDGVTYGGAIKPDSVFPCTTYKGV